MSEFTASNGVTVAPFDREHGAVRLSNGMVPTAESVRAIGEYCEHLRDEALGRWRWPENTDYVVYDDPHDTHRGLFGSDIDIVVMCESDGVTKGYCRREDKGGEPSYWRVDFIFAARAYFDAHPEPKLWDGAEPGEFWVVTLHDVERLCRVIKPNFSLDVGLAFLPIDTDSLTTWFAPSDAITAARRIWPEATS